MGRGGAHVTWSGMQQPNVAYTMAQSHPLVLCPLCSRGMWLLYPSPTCARAGAFVGIDDWLVMLNAFIR